MHIEGMHWATLESYSIVAQLRDCLICSHAIEQWARVGCNGRGRARLLPARHCTCKPGSASGNILKY